jgi:hypothetical protein
VRVPVPEPFPVEVPVSAPQALRVELPLPLETPLPQAYPVEAGLPAFSFGRFPFGKPFPEIPLPISGSYPLPGIADCTELATPVLPATFSAPLLAALKDSLPIRRHGYHGF